MSTTSRVSWSLTALTSVALVAGCATTPSAPADAASADEDRTVLVERAKPALVLFEEEGESSYQEDTAVARETVEVPFQPSAVITFDIATLDTLHAIGAGDAVIGIPDVVLPDYLAAYSDLPKVGTLFEPDLIVTAARSTGQYDELSEISTTIDLTAAYAGAFSPAAGIERAEQLGEIFGAEDEVAH